MDLIGRVSLLRDQKDNADAETPSITDMCALLDVARTTVYNRPTEPSEQEIVIKNRIDQLHNLDPTWGARTISKKLVSEGLFIGRSKTRRYMTEMGIDAIYPKPNLSRANLQHKKYPYLLKNMNIERSNQVWAIDITYIRMGRSFCYLTAIIDWHSRYIVGWELDDTLSSNAVIKALNRAFVMYGTP